MWEANPTLRSDWDVHPIELMRWSIAGMRVILMPVSEPKHEAGQLPDRHRSRPKITMN